MPEIAYGATAQIIEVFIPDNRVVTGEGLPGLAYNAAGLTCYYKRRSAGASVEVELVDATLGVWTSGGFKEIDPIGMLGWYEFGIPNAALVVGSPAVSFHFRGYEHMVPTPLRLDLIVPDQQTAIGLKRNAAFTGLPFTLYDNQTRLPKADVDPEDITVQRLIDNGAFAAGTLGNMQNKSKGVYTVDGQAADVNGAFVTLWASAPGCSDTLLTIVTVP